MPKGRRPTDIRMRSFLQRRLAKQLKIGAIAIMAAVALLLGAWAFSRGPALVPTAVVELGEFADAVPLHGELQVRKSVSISAPAGAGDLQIVKIAEDGAPVKQGDIVVQFDATKIEQDLAQYRSALKSSEA